MRHAHHSIRDVLVSHWKKWEVTEPAGGSVCPRVILVFVAPKMFTNQSSSPYNPPPSISSNYFLDWIYSNHKYDIFDSQKAELHKKKGNTAALPNFISGVVKITHLKSLTT